jgi:hypothetical protein
VAGYMANAMGNLSMHASASSRRGIAPTKGVHSHPQHQQEHSVASLRQRQMSSSIF